MTDTIIRLACGAYRKWIWIAAAGQLHRVLWNERVGAMAGPVGKLP